MPQSCRCHRIVNEGFEELTLALGGVAASYEIPDKAVWDLAQVINRVYRRALSKIGPDHLPPALAQDLVDANEHPAITRLLRQLREDTGQ